MGLVDLIVLAAYFVGITVFGASFGRFTRSTRDFFIAGQRFPTWLITASCIATLVGSYSFVKYSATGYQYGIACTQTYLNDWMWMPLWMFGWLPILYFGGILTVPEYFARRFGPRVRLAATITLLFYLVGYIGINLYTIGTAIWGMFAVQYGLSTDWIFWVALLMAGMCMAYEFTGGQTSVIFTDLLQSALLLLAGLGLFALGIVALGGFDVFWARLPAGHGRALPPFAEDPRFNFVGVFWQDGIAGGLGFWFMNQGLLLRFLSARSIGTARRAAGIVVLVLMPITAIAVAGTGWIGRALVADGQMQIQSADTAFLDVARLLCHNVPGLFGLVVAALLAALMSTADTLINATSSVVVNDVYRPARPGRNERHYLTVARYASLAAALAGVGLVPLYMTQAGIYQAHGFFIALITPPMASALLLAFVWPRFNSAGAMASLVGGIVAMFLSWAFPILVEPFAHGIAAHANGDSGKPAYIYIRACYGMIVSMGLGIGATLLSANDRRPHAGLTLWTCRQRRSSRPLRRPRKVTTTVMADARTKQATATDQDAIDLVLSAAIREALQVETGDRVFVDDARRYLGGLRSVAGTVSAEIAEDQRLRLPPTAMTRNRWRNGQPVRLERC